MITFIYSFFLSTKYCALLISTKEISNVKKQLEISNSRLQKLINIQHAYQRIRTGIFNIMIGPDKKQKEQAYDQLKNLFNKTKEDREI